jgi:hypothetical protein
MSPASCKKTSYAFNTFIQALFSSWSPPGTVEGREIITLPKPGKDLKFSPNLRPISLFSTIGKLFEKMILKTIQKHAGKEIS